MVEVKEYYEFGSSEKIVNVKGKLRENVSFYQSIGAPDFALNVIRNGYKLPFVNFPDSVILPNNRSARVHSSFVDEALLELLSSGRVIQVVDAPFVVNPLSVSVLPGGKKRLILDLRHVNKCLKKYHFKDVRAHCHCASLVRTLYMTWHAPCHVFQARAQSRNSTKYRADDLCELFYPRIFLLDAQ